MTDDETYTAPIITEAQGLQAYRLGVQAAKNAASWIVDGNTTQEHIARVIKQIEDGDPQLGDWLIAPTLSGEWADDPTHQSLFEEITGMAPIAEEYAQVDALAEAWERGVSDTFQPECERILRGALNG